MPTTRTTELTRLKTKGRKFGGELQKKEGKTTGTSRGPSRKKGKKKKKKTARRSRKPAKNLTGPKKQSSAKVERGHYQKEASHWGIRGKREPTEGGGAIKPE